MQLSPSQTAIDASIQERRSIRSFRPDAVPRELVAELLAAACWAPSPHNSQPWRFTALFGVREKERLAQAMADRLEADLRDQGVDAVDIRRQSNRSRVRISSAPVAVVCSLVTDGLVEYADDRMQTLEWQMAVQSVGAVLQSLFLLAHARGLGTCWMAAPMYCPDEVRAALGLPEEQHPQALVLIGYPAHPGKRRERRHAREVTDLR